MCAGAVGAGGAVCCCCGGAGEADITMLAPIGTPAVFDNPIIFAGCGGGSRLGAETHEQDTMVGVGAAARGINDTPLIKLERRLIGLNGHRDGSIVQRIEEGVLVVGFDIIAGREVCAGEAVGAGALLCRVGVVFLGAHTILNGVTEGVVHDAAIAAMVAVSGGTIQELLLGKADVLAGVNHPGTLKCSGGGETPAAAAFSLVFHRCDDAEIAPIELVEKAMVLKGVGDARCVAILACLETAGFDV